MNAQDIIKLREANGWTQLELASRLGVNQSTVCRIENGSAISGPLRLLLSQLAGRQ